jgi:hypothetical protein
LLVPFFWAENVHSREKHGAQTTGIKQYRRVQREDYPNPTTGEPGNKTKVASKFLTNKDHYEVLRSAILQRKASPELYDFNVSMDRNIGVSIKNLGSYKDRGPRRKRGQIYLSGSCHDQINKSVPFFWDLR